MSTGGYSQIALLVKALGRGSPDLLKKAIDRDASRIDRGASSLGTLQLCSL
jgi:hypothetical protein